MHGFCTAKYIQDVIWPELLKGAVKSGRDPKTIDFGYQSPEGHVAILHGIYEFLPDGAVRLAFDSGYDGRPDAFSTKPGSNRRIFILKRRNKKPPLLPTPTAKS